ncbi:hypothetical protein RCH09_003119 [Actimicrobium sp. GrIS 1.19]|nr:hypothetical protein [Actimicrobium sp. GrIS 1.19]
MTTPLAPKSTALSARGNAASGGGFRARSLPSGAATSVNNHVAELRHVAETKLNAQFPVQNEFRIEATSGETFSPSRICRLTHNFQHHPLMELRSLRRLAKSFEDTKHCRFVKQRLTATSAFDHHSADPNGRRIDQVFDEIQTPGSWIALYDIQDDPEYRRLLWMAIGTALPMINPSEKIISVQGHVFISAPPSLTPFHIDRESNFWLQIRGQKSMHLWDRMDREVVAAPELESFIAYRSLEKIRLKESFRNRSLHYSCRAGDGAYMPSTTPHMTFSEDDEAPGNALSISLSVTFYSNVTRRSNYVHVANSVLRRLNINPTPAGVDILRDRMKYPLGRAIVAAKILRGYSPPAGF